MDLTINKNFKFGKLLRMDKATLINLVKILQHKNRILETRIKFFENVIGVKK